MYMYWLAMIDKYFEKNWWRSSCVFVHLVRTSCVCHDSWSLEWSCTFVWTIFLLETEEHPYRVDVHTISWWYGKSRCHRCHWCHSTEASRLQGGPRICKVTFLPPKFDSWPPEKEPFQEETNISSNHHFFRGWTVKFSGLDIRKWSMIFSVSKFVQLGDRA